MVIETQHPEFGVVRQVASPIKISDYEHPHQRGPLLGEHTDDVLQELLELTPDQLQALRDDGVL